MCTSIILRRPGHRWPLLFAANRDELKTRSWLPPGRHWRDRPEVIAGMDKTAGGSWLGLNDHGVMAAVLNRAGSLGPQDNKRSRGELVLEALDHADAAVAADYLKHLDPRAYRSFNLIVADNQDAFWLRSQGQQDDGSPAASQPGASQPGASQIEVFTLPTGLSMITAHDRNDVASARIRAYLPRFELADAPDPGLGDWGAWQSILSSRLYEAKNGPTAAMTIETETGFGTVSSSLLALPGFPESATERAIAPVWLFAPGPPDKVTYQPVKL